MSKRILLITTLLLSCCCIWSQSIPQLINNSSKYPGSDLVILFDSTKVDVQETGLSYVNKHILYKVLTPEGAKEINAIKYDYDPLSAWVEIRKAKIYRKNGDVEDLNVDETYDYPAPAHMIYWGARQKMIEIGRLEPGDAVEIEMFRKGYTYALLQTDEDERYIPPMRGHFYDIIEFWSNHPVKEKIYDVTIPASKFVQYRFYNGDPDTTILKNENEQCYIFGLKNIMPIKKEPQMVALSDIAPKLLISTSPDWESKSKWFYNVNEDFGSFESTPEIDDKVAEILKNAKDEMDSVSKLTHWVADEIRYSGISMGEGEGFTLHKGEMTFTDRCGVCKDKAGMLITMLRAAGFDSYPAMTMAGSRIDTIPADQFNHCVTIVKLADKKYHLLDPTWVPWVRELWSSAEQQQNYLMGVPEGADLAITPISNAENHYFNISGESVLNLDGSLEGKFTLTAEGQTDAGLRRIFVRGLKSEWDKTIEAELRKTAPHMKISSINYGDDPYDYTDPLRITISYRIPDFALVTDKEIIFVPLVASNLFKSYASHLRFDTSLEERKYAFKDRCSRQVELTESITLPPNKEVLYRTDTLFSEGSGADFNGYYRLNGNKLELYEKANFKKRVYEAAEWPSVREAVISQNKFADEYIIIKK